MAKKLVAIPADRICTECKKGRMISEGLRRSIVLGEFFGKAYRVCDRCGATSQTPERFIGVEIDIPEDRTPGLFDDVSDDTEDVKFRPSESYM